MTDRGSAGTSENTPGGNVGSKTDAPSRTSVEESPQGASTAAIVRAIARAESRRYAHRYAASRRQRALLLFGVALLLPVFGILLRGAHDLGHAVESGQADGLLAVARWYLPVSLGMYVFLGAIQAGQRFLNFEASELLLTTVRERDLTLALLWAGLRSLFLLLVTPLAGLVVAFAIGTGSPTVAVGALLAASLCLLAAMLVGFVLGLFLRVGLENVRVSGTTRSLMNALGIILGALVFSVGGVYVGSLTAQFEQGISLSTIAPDGAPPIILGYYADFLFLGTPLVDGITVQTLLSGLVVVGSIPVSVWLLVVVAPRLWQTDTATPPADETESTRAESIDAPVTGQQSRPSWPWLRVSVGYVADGLFRRSIRAPQRLVHVSYYVLITGVLVAGAISDPSLLPTLLGGSIVLLGIWLAGGAFGLNPLGEEGAMLEQLVLTTVPARTFVRSRILAGTCVGVPFVLAGTALLTVRALSPIEALVLGAFWLLLTPASAAIALGIGTLLPQSEPGRVLDVVDTRPPEMTATVFHAVGTAALAVGGGLLVSGEFDSWIQRGGLAVGTLFILLVADAGYRFAVNGFATYGKPRRADPFYTLELATGIGVLGLILSITVQTGALVLIPVSGGPGFIVAFVGGFAGWALAGVVYLLAVGRLQTFIDAAIPTVTDLRYTTGGILVSLGVYTVIVGMVVLLDAPIVAHTIAQEMLTLSPFYVLVLIVLTLAVNATVEEFLFRNVIQKRLSETISSAKAIVWTATVFAVVHVPMYFSTDLVAVAVTLTPLFVLSIVWGWLYHRTGNVVVPALCHGVYNAVIFVLLYARLL